ncbi:hypothetical protein [uncultured Psychroserpens sp.]|uniref:hypothetical protein n=1 Tax=uncultured Psychroserpens sp. TaxID=255436 RepID=UPI00261453E2|nr:hypothetical protein [uncultured Psychroserpens sp.]
MRYSLCIIFCISIISISICSCSKNDDDIVEEQLVAEPTFEELLVEFSPWSFTNYEVLEIVSTTNENITADDINNYTSELLAGFIMEFTEDGVVILNHPISGEITRTWTLFEEDIIFDIDSNTPQIWQNIQVEEGRFSIETQLFSIFEQTFEIVEHYGQLNFE